MRPHKLLYSYTLLILLGSDIGFSSSGSVSEAPVTYHVSVLDPKKGVCVDPVGRDAILEVEGPGPPVGVSERQLSPDRGGGKT
jgi:hypothetical protein